MVSIAEFSVVEIDTMSYHLIVNPEVAFVDLHDLVILTLPDFHEIRCSEVELADLGHLRQVFGTQLKVELVVGLLFLLDVHVDVASVKEFAFQLSLNVPRLLHELSQSRLMSTNQLLLPALILIVHFKSEVQNLSKIEHDREAVFPFGVKRIKDYLSLVDFEPVGLALLPFHL